MHMFRRPRALAQATYVSQSARFQATVHAAYRTHPARTGRVHRAADVKRKLLSIPDLPRPSHVPSGSMMGL